MEAGSLQHLLGKKQAQSLIGISLAFEVSFIIRVEDFDRVDMRAGTVIDVKDKNARKGNRIEITI